MDALMKCVYLLSYYSKKVYEVCDDLELGVIPEMDELAFFIQEIERLEETRVSLLEELGESNFSHSYMDEPIIFKDNGILQKGSMSGPIEGAIDFIREHSVSDDVFMKQMAAYVAVCI